jgi:hypothetical protein
VRNDFSALTIGARARPITNRQDITGDGWTLSVNPGWLLRPDPTRGGSFVVSRNQ